MLRHALVLVLACSAGMHRAAFDAASLLRYCCLHVERVGSAAACVANTKKNPSMRDAPHAVTRGGWPCMQGWFHGPVDAAMQSAIENASVNQLISLKQVLALEDACFTVALLLLYCCFTAR